MTHLTLDDLRRTDHSDLLKQIVNAEDAYYRDYHISNARAALAAEPASGETGRHLTKDEQGVLHRALRKSATVVRNAALPPPPTQGEEERLWDIACDCLRFRKDDPLRLAENTTVERILAVLRHHADEAMRAENEACAKIANAALPHSWPQDIAAAIRARIAQP